MMGLTSQDPRAILSLDEFMTEQLVHHIPANLKDNKERVTMHPELFGQRLGYHAVILKLAPENHQAGLGRVCAAAGPGRCAGLSLFSWVKETQCQPGQSCFVPLLIAAWRRRAAHSLSSLGTMSNADTKKIARQPPVGQELGLLCV